MAGPRPAGKRAVGKIQLRPRQRSSRPFREGFLAKATSLRCKTTSHLPSLCCPPLKQTRAAEPREAGRELGRKRSGSEPAASVRHPGTDNRAAESWSGAGPEGPVGGKDICNTLSKATGMRILFKIELRPRPVPQWVGPPPCNTKRLWVRVRSGHISRLLVRSLVWVHLGGN